MPKEWEQIKRLFIEALQVKAEDRAAFLATVCAEDTALRNEIESLLAAYAQADQYMETPALAGLLAPTSIGETIQSGATDRQALASAGLQASDRQNKTTS